MDVAGKTPLIETERLLLRAWTEDDRTSWAEMGGDIHVMEYFPNLHTRERSDEMLDRFNNHIFEHGFGFWALEDRKSGEFIGFTGLLRSGIAAHFTPCVEIGWRLARSHWGKGYATEAALASLEFGFERLGLKEIAAMAVVANLRSRRVMERIGMTRDFDSDFDHPGIPAGHPLQRHVLYRISADAYFGLRRIDGG
ncbi:MAG: GNAT family N-acetyltransferase [Hyphomicrobiales bacterium]|nr:GNAT family N-acetyltransferase [Hyphomicrobiales bacterium]